MVRSTRDRRHRLASRVVALGGSLPMIGCLFGLFKVEATERYAHLASDWLKESAVRISESIAADNCVSQIVTWHREEPGT